MRIAREGAKARREAAAIKLGRGFSESPNGESSFPPEMLLLLRGLAPSRDHFDVSICMAATLNRNGEVAGYFSRLLGGDIKGGAPSPADAAHSHWLYFQLSSQFARRSGRRMALPSSTRTVRIPGTTANLGPGFDTLGLALRLYNRVSVTRVPGRKVNLVSPIPEESKTAAHELLAKAAEAFFQKTRKRSFGCEVAITGDVPLARGLGSSVTARLGCVAGLNELTGRPLERGDLFQLVTQLEGHPDNAAPALFGGFTAATMVGNEARAIRFPVPTRIKFVTLIPDFEVSTPAARKLVPLQFSKADAVHNLTRVALITAAFGSGQVELLRGCFDDRLHQPYRQQLIPQLSRVIQAGEGAGAIGGWLSGSGSTIICLAVENAAAIARAMHRELPNSHVHVLSADSRGLQVLS